MTTIPNEFLAAFYALEAAFPDWKVKPSAQGIPGTVDVYWQALSDLPVADVCAAMGFAIQNGDFAPRIAALRSRASALAQERDVKRVALESAQERLREDARLEAAWKDKGERPSLSKMLADLQKRAAQL